jgi:CHAT domain
MKPMKIILTIFPGTLDLPSSFENGYQGILSSSQEINIKQQFQLPPNLDIAAKYDSWNRAYEEMRLYGYRKLGSNSNKPKKTAQSYIDLCTTESEELIQLFNDWLEAPGFRSAKEKILSNFSESEENLLIIETEDTKLWQLPWHKWRLIEFDYLKTEVVISLPNFTPLPLNQRPASSNNIRILSVLGDDSGIDLEEDKKVLNSILQTNTKNRRLADIKFIPQPSHPELDEALRLEWDILCFSGHSTTEDGKCFIQINQDDSISIENLSEALRGTGIKIAIFNSCDNLGVASSLERVRVLIPYLLLMSKEVHDYIAQEFFKYFIKEYHSGQSFYLSVRAARSQLQKHETQYPCSTWLPTIVQHDTSLTAPIWNNLLKPVNSNSSKHSKVSEILLGVIAFISVSVGSIFAWQNTVKKNSPEIAYFWLENKHSQMALTVTTSHDNKILLTQQAIVNGKPNKDQLFTWAEEAGDSRRVTSYAGLAWTVKNNIDQDKNLVILSKDNDYPNQLFTFEKISDNWWLTIHHFQAKNTKYNRLSILGNNQGIDTVFVRKVTDNPTTEKEEELWKIHWAK